MIDFLKTDDATTATDQLAVALVNLEITKSIKVVSLKIKIYLSIGKGSSVLLR